MKTYATLESQLAATHAALSVAEDALATAQAEIAFLRQWLRGATLTDADIDEALRAAA